MSERPVECKFCGTSCSAEIQGILTFRCGSVWFHKSEKWMQFAGCERNVLRAKIGRAVEAMKGAERFNTITAWDGEILSARHVADGEWTRADVLDDAIRILEGQQ